MSSRQIIFLGQDLSQYVVDWGTIDDTKDVLLAQTQLFAGQYQIKLGNGNSMFTPFNSTSLFYGRPTQNQIASIYLNGAIAYYGLVKSVDLDGQTREATLTMENFFSKPTSMSASLVASKANPAAAMVSIFENAGLQSYLDLGSFSNSGAAAAAAGATIGVNYSGTSSTTILSAIQAISQLCSISVYVRDGLIRARDWRPYQGHGAEIKWLITPSIVRSFTGTLSDAYDNLNNSVTIGYGASSTITLTNTSSIQQYGVTNNFPFSSNTGSLTVPDLKSANYFGNLFLARASTLRRTGDLDAGPELQLARLGDRCYVTAPNWGINTPTAFEIIETHQKPQENGIGLKIATI